MPRDPSTDAFYEGLDSIAKRGVASLTHYAPAPLPLGGDGYRNVCDDGRDAVQHEADKHRAEGRTDVADAIEAGQKTLALQAEATKHRQRGKHAIANAIEAGIGHLAHGSGNTKGG